MMNSRVTISISIVGVILLTSVSLQAFPSDKKKADWTMILYLGGDPPQIGSFEKVTSFILNITQKIPVLTLGRVNIVGLLDIDKNCIFRYKRGVLGISRLEIIENLDEINTGNYATLRDFIIYCKTHYPAKRYLLFIQGHGAAWKYLCPDYLTGEENNTFDYLTPSEIKKALQESGGVDIFQTGGCFMGNLEAAFELRNCTKVYIGSEESVDTLYPFGLFFATIKVLRENPKADEYKIAKKIVRLSFRRQLDIIQFFIHRFAMRGSFSRSSTFSAIRTDKLQTLTERLDSLSKKLIINFSRYRRAVDISRLEAETFGRKDLVDLYDFLQHLERNIKDPSSENILNDIRMLKKYLRETILLEKHQRLHPNAHGLTIFFPLPSKGDLSYNMLQDYASCNLEFINDTHWDEFLHLYLMSN